MQEVSAPLPLSKRTVLWRGLCLCCPACGEGKLFRGYITQNKICANCSENLETLRADDGPPWLTILIVGHLIVPLLVTIEHYKLMTFWTEIIVMVSAALICSALTLPRAKGFFIAALWIIRQQKDQ